MNVERYPHTYIYIYVYIYIYMAYQSLVPRCGGASRSPCLLPPFPLHICFYVKAVCSGAVDSLRRVQHLNKQKPGEKLGAPVRRVATGESQI